MIEVREIHRHDADRIVVNNHYSGTKCFGTKVSLGIYYNGMLCGVAQFGTGVNPKGTCKWVEGSTMEDYMEFNRMWLSDIAPRNSESQAIGKIFKWFKKNRPEIKWLISFADGVMGKVGTIYQATNWIYTGYNKAGGLWVTKDGVRMHHAGLALKHKDTKRDTLESIYGTPLYRAVGGQFRYIYFLDKRWKKRLTVEPKEYPKASNLRDYISIKKENWVIEDLWDEFQTVLR